MAIVKPVFHYLNYDAKLCCAQYWYITVTIDLKYPPKESSNCFFLKTLFITLNKYFSYIGEILSKMWLKYRKRFAQTKSMLVVFTETWQHCAKSAQ